MDLESRVQALEQELEILKNQIQATLLEIQEQVLANTYPSLRGDDTNPPPNNAPHNPQPERPLVQQVMPVQAVADNNPVRKFSAVEEQLYHPPQSAQPEQPRVRPTRQGTGFNSVAELEGWATQKIEQMGIERTVELIFAYGQTGQFTPDMQDTLLDYVSMYRNNDAPTEPHRPAFANQLQQQPVVPQPKAAPVTNNNRPKVAKQAPSPAAVTQPKRPTAPVPKPAPVKAAKPSKAAKSENSEVEQAPQSTVLRLIAGVQNAGAGVRWRKGNG
jgi:hypothetical protein